MYVLERCFTELPCRSLLADTPLLFLLRFLRAQVGPTAPVLLGGVIIMCWPLGAFVGLEGPRAAAHVASLRCTAPHTFLEVICGVESPAQHGPRGKRENAAATIVGIGRSCLLRGLIPEPPGIPPAPSRDLNPTPRLALE